MRKIISFLLCVFLVFSVLFSCVEFVGRVEGQLGTLYESYSPSSSTGFTTQTALFFGNIFTASATYDLAVVSFYLGVSAVPPTGCMLYVCETDGTYITSVINSVSFSVDTLPIYNSRSWLNISVSGGITLTAGQRYALILSHDDSGGSSYLGCMRSNTGSVAGLNGATGNTFPPSPAGGAWAFNVYGLPAGSTAEGDLSYTFVNGGYDSNPQGQATLALSFVTTAGRVVTASLPPNQSMTVNFAPLVSMSWNFSSALNLTRTIEFTGNDGVVGVGMTVFPLYAADPDTIMGVYVFSVVDYTASVQFIEVSLGGVVVERRNIALAGSADFSLVKGLPYTVTVLGVKGAFSQSFLASNVFSSNIVVLEGSFGDSVSWTVPVFTVTRSSNNSVVELFFDASAGEAFLVSDFNFSISKRVGGSEFVVVLGGVNSEFYPFSYVWDMAEVDVDYVVRAWVVDSGSGMLLRSWVVSCGVNHGGVGGNPWGSLIAPFFGDLKTLPGSFLMPTGFDAAQLPATAVLFLVLAIFSFASHGKGCILCWVVALIMVALGWFVVSLPAFGLALVFSVFILFIEGKQTEREL
jgi:hypothetical protein